MDVAVLGLTIDSSGTVPRLKEVEGGLKRVGQVAKQVEKESTDAVRRETFTRQQLLNDRSAREAVLAREGARKQVKAWADAAEHELEYSQARIRLDAARGFITKEEAARHGREAAMAFNAEIGRIHDRGTAMGAFSGRQGDALFLGMSGRLKNVGEEAQKASLNMGRLRESMTSMAASALHAAPGVTQLSSAVGSMALGSALTIGVLAGVAAIGLAWRELTEDAREAKKVHKEAIDELERLEKRQREGALGGVGGNIIEAGNEIFDNDRRIRDLRAKRTRTLGRGRESDIVAAAEIQGEIDELEKRNTRLTQMMQAGERERTKIVQDEAKKREDERKRESSSATTAARAQQQALIEGIRLGTASDAEIDKAIILRRALRDVEDDLTLSLTDRNAAAKIALDITKALNEATGQQPRRAMRVDPSRVRVPSAGTVRGPDASFDETITVENEAARRAMQAAWDEAIRGIQRSFASGFEAIQRDGLQGFGSFADSLVGVFQGAAANIASVLASEALGLDDMLARLKNMSTDDVGAALSGEGLGQGSLQRFGAGALAGGMAGFRGGIGSGVTTGVMTGLLAGGPAGAAVGALAGLAGGILGLGDAAKESARIFREAQEQFTDSVEASITSMRLSSNVERTGFDFGQQAQQRFEDFLKTFSMRVDFKKLGAEPPRTQDVNAWIEFFERLQPHIRGAPTDEFARMQEEAAELAKRWAEQIAKANKEMSEDISVRRLASQGRTAEAEALRLQIQQQREYAEALEAGLNPDVLKALEEVQAAEFKRAEENRVRTNREAQEDYAVRIAVAEGRTMEADRMRFALDQQREYNEAVLSGLDAATLAALGLAQAAEAAAFAAAQAKAKADFESGIESAFLRSQGKDQEADQFDLDRDQERRRQEAVDKEVDQDWLDKLDKIFEWEDGQLAARYMQDAAETMQDAAKINARRASEDTVRSVTAISESSALRLVDLSRSQVGLLAAIEMNTRGRPGDGVWVNSRSGGRGVVVHVTQQFYGPVTTTQQFTQQLGAEIGRQVNEALGKDAEREARFTGSGAV